MQARRKARRVWSCYWRLRRYQGNGGQGIPVRQDLGACTDRRLRTALNPKPLHCPALNHRNVCHFQCICEGHIFFFTFILRNSSYFWISFYDSLKNKATPRVLWWSWIYFVGGASSGGSSGGGDFGVIDACEKACITSSESHQVIHCKVQ